MDYADRIQALRTRVQEIEHALNSFQRKSDESPTAVGTPLPARRSLIAGSLRISKMIRYADETAWADLYAKVAGITAELNSLEAEIDDEIENAFDDGVEEA